MHRREARQRLVSGRVMGAIGTRRARVVAEGVADETLSTVQRRMEEALVHTRQVVADEQAENEHGKSDGKPRSPAELRDQAQSPG
jgi:hypothetical protein